MSIFEGATNTAKYVKPPIVTPKPNSREIVHRISVTRTTPNNSGAEIENHGNRTSQDAIR